MSLQVIITCGGLRPVGNTKGETCRSWRPLGVDPESLDYDELNAVINDAYDRAAAAGWSFPARSTLCASCTRWLLEHPDDEEKILGYKREPLPLRPAYGWTPVTPQQRGQHVLEQQAKLTDLFAAELDVPPCLLAHAWSEWEERRNDTGRLLLWERTCQREHCEARDIQAA